MRPPGSFKLTKRPRLESPASDPLGFSESRSQKIVDSLCCEILEGENLRIRQIFERPRAIYRIEFDRPDLKYQRITLLDEDTLEELLEIDEVRNRVADALG